MVDYKAISPVEIRRIKELMQSGILNAFSQQDFQDLVSVFERVTTRMLLFGTTGGHTMTPLEEARRREAAGGVDYCDECEAFVVIRGTAYCERSGKLIHPIMLERGPGTGPAQNCKDRFIGDKEDAP